MVGWYRIYNKKYQDEKYDVKDTTADQVYEPGSEATNTTNAINAVGNIGLLNSSNELFYPAYAAGVSGEAGSQSGGQMKQYGSKYLAEKGYSHSDILGYYYDSSSVSTGKIKTFTY